MAIQHSNGVDSTWFVTALESRAVVGMALGITMERYGLDRAGAFDHLRRQSNDRNIKLRDLSAALIAEHEASHHLTQQT